ncbi:MAG: glycoside hydrolase family 2 TIM barrel-domain containing protein, partial [Candidatus Solibacter sp.]
MTSHIVFLRRMAGAALAALLFSAALGTGFAQTRERQLFDNGWRFHLGDVPNGQAAALADIGWRNVDLPHDWSIEGPFDSNHASGTGFLPGGIAWYRKTFQLPAAAPGRRVSIRFDGVYRDSTVWINGAEVGSRPYGYSSFEYDLTPHLRQGAANVLAVRVDHSVIADSRWYPGSGIYRHVWLNVTGPVHIAPWGVYVTTPVVGADEALVSVETRVANRTQAEARATVVTSVVGERGEELASTKGEEAVAAGKERMYAQQVAVARPLLWSPDRPHLYALVSRVYLDGKLVDEQHTAFGIRSFYFSAEKGLVFNGTPLKMKGVCIHHDLGALGAAFFEEALERRLKSFKEMGVNAIRCSHNPMAPEFYDLCDRLGLLVMDEAFDEWAGGKRKWAEGRNNGAVARRGYNEAFAAWGARDAADMVLRDRNHASIVMWSIGNEIDYPDDPFTHPRGRGFDASVPQQPGVKKAGLSADLMPEMARRLIAAVKQFDTTRPVTMALADINASNASGVANMLDVVGYNYLEQFYERDHKAYPNRVIYGSENSRSLEAWRATAVNDWVGGQFLWTGMNFLGEAGRYPTHGSNSGLLDLQGFWKRDAYLRQALWSAKPMVYAAAWNPGADEARMADWPRSLGRVQAAERWGFAGDARKNVPVEIYSNCESVELVLNGRSLGEKKMADPLSPAMVWAVPNEAGTLDVIGKRAGVASARFQLKTAGAAERLELTADLKVLKNAGRQVAT